MEELETENLILRKFKIEDAEQVFENCAKVEKIANLANFNAHKSVLETKTIIESGLRCKQFDYFSWVIVQKSNNECIGFVRIYEISKKNKSCKIIWALKKELWNTGISVEAMKKIINFLFEKKGFEIVISEYYSKVDELKRPILENVGMKKDAELRKRKIEDGKSYSKVIYSITKDEI